MLASKKGYNKVEPEDVETPDEIEAQYKNTVIRIGNTQKQIRYHLNGKL